jgi:putative DNA primase/helicase
MTADPAALFLEAMAAAGIHPLEPIHQQLASGQLIRFRAEGDRPGRRNGWAILHCDGAIPAGAFGHYRLSIYETWRAEGSTHLPAHEREAQVRAWRQERERRERAKLAEWERVTHVAGTVWGRARKADPDHPYLVRKGIAPWGLRQSGKWLLVPMRDDEGRLWNVQRIDFRGTKLFLTGGRTQGLFWSRGRPRGLVCIGEGFATMAAVHRATGYAVAAAFSASNLEPVALALRRRWPLFDIVLCADDDAHLPNNIGVISARAAALAVSGRVALPPAAKD